MKKNVLTFGLLSGVVSATLMFLNMSFMDPSAWISFLFVYFWIRSYRDNVLGGRITFGKGFQAGILITLTEAVLRTPAASTNP
jgi:uncharacterized membrane protein YedE/YeeE